MNTSRITKVLAAAALAAGAVGVAQAAHAGTDVYFSVGVPAPVYYDAQPAYVPQPVYAQPAEVYVRPGYGDWRWRREQMRREEIRREEWRREEMRREQWRHWQHEQHEHREGYGGWGDRRD